MLVGQHFLGKILGHGEIIEIAEVEIFAPFGVAAKVGERGLDLDNGEEALCIERDDIGAPPVPDREFGERLLAFVVRSGDSDIDSQGIIKWLSSKISGYKVPREYVFQDSLPREDSGKVFKKELRSQYWVDSDAKI